MKQAVIDFFKNPLTGETDYKKAGIAAFVVVLIIAFAVKLVRDGSKTPTTDKPNPSGNGTNNQSSTNTTTQQGNGQQGQGNPMPVNYPYDVQVFAKEMYDFTQLTGYTWLCRQPNNFCYHLLKLADLPDDFILQLSKVYQSRYGKKLSDDIEKNGCTCSNEFVAAHIAYPMDKGSLLKRIKALGA